ncbi:hypothetical protein SLE2022_391320 [Rubroshorea leprosula]
MPNQVNLAYPVGFVANYQGCQNNPIRRAPTAYGPYPASYSSIPGAGNGHYQISHTRQYIDGRNRVPGPGTNFSGGSMIEPSLSGTALSSEYVYYPPNGQISSFVYPYPVLQAPRPPTALSSALPSNPNVYFRLSLSSWNMPTSHVQFWRMYPLWANVIAVKTFWKQSSQPTIKVKPKDKLSHVIAEPRAWAYMHSAGCWNFSFKDEANIFYRHWLLPFRTGTTLLNTEDIW